MRSSVVARSAMRVHAATCVAAPLALFLAASAFAQSPTASGAPIALAEGVTLSASQGAGETVDYTFAADGGRNYLIEVQQQGLDLRVRLSGPESGERVFDSPLLRDGSELVLIENARRGAYEITVASDEHTGARGGHSIRVTAPAPNELAASRATSVAAERNVKGGLTEWTAARNAYLEAADGWRVLGMTQREAQARLAAGMLDYWRTKDYASAAALAVEAGDLYAASDDDAMLASARCLQATSLMETAEEAANSEAEYARALALLEQAAATQRNLGRVYDLARTTNEIGLLHYMKGDWRNARRYWTDASLLFRSLDEWSGELYPVANLAVVDAEEGHLALAIESLQHALELMPPGRNPRQRADALANMGGLQRMYGNFDDALGMFSAALTLGNELEDAYVVGWALFGIGETYYSMGELELAAEYLQASLPKEREAGDARGEAAVLRYLGSIEHSRGNHAAALELHEQALALATAPPDRALVELLLAEDLAALRRYDEAARAANSALDIASQTDSVSLRADALEQLGRVELGRDARAAMVTLQQALAIYASLGLHTEQARTLNALALAAASLGDLPRAVDFGASSLTHIESVRGNLADPKLRAFYLSAREDYYELQIDLLMRLAGSSPVPEVHERSALAVSERARARMLVDLLHESAIDLKHPNAELESRRRELYSKLEELRSQRDRALAHDRSAAGESVESVVAELASVENELNLLEAEERTQSPRWGSVSAPKILAGSELQQAVDSDSVLIEYALGKDESYAWVVTRESTHGVELASRETIESAAKRVYEALRRPRSGADAGLAADLNRLADLVIAPIAPLLSKDRVIVAADGALQYVPFAALPLRSQDGTSAPLIASREVVGIPSLSAAVGHRAGASRTAPSKSVAIFADPVFDGRDPRMPAQYLATAESAEPPILAQREATRGGTALARLPLSAREAQVIAGLVPESERFVAVGFDASRDAVLRTNLEDYRIVHFATHGLIDPRYPDLSSLALSQFDSTGTRTNGFLRLPDIYGLRLNADLVVLSACETALGRDIRGEGLLGLTQGFLYAGAKSLVASLWPVADRATAELMARFYDNALKQGMRPAEALRRAQLSIAAEPRWRDPYYWSAFVLLGEWR